jgi:hypothetical protein
LIFEDSWVRKQSSESYHDTVVIDFYQ